MNSHIVNDTGSEGTTSATKNKSSFRTIRFLWKHKLNFMLLIALLVCLAFWQFERISLKKELSEIEKKHAEMIDSLHNSKYVELTRAYSWAIRSDMMRNNLDQTNQYLLKMTEEDLIVKAFIISPDEDKILLSSDPIDTDRLIKDVTLLNITESKFVKIKDNLTRFAEPITGFNKQIGTLVLEVETK